MFKYLLISCLFSITICKSQEANNKAQIQTPKTFKALQTKDGDLDKDGIPERVVVYNTPKMTDMGTQRQIYIYKKQNTQWVLWQTIIGAVLPSKHGGMMGNPFEGMSIINHCIVLYHAGGSRERWHYTHKFRYQNNQFQLIGATTNVNMPCNSIISFDYNLSNGKMIYKKETAYCQKENTVILKKEYTVKPKQLPTMTGFYPGNNKLVLPNSKITVYY